jgi:hypothetical protein
MGKLITPQPAEQTTASQMVLDITNILEVGLTKLVAEKQTAEDKASVEYNRAEQLNTDIQAIAALVAKYV